LGALSFVFLRILSLKEKKRIYLEAGSDPGDSPRKHLKLKRWWLVLIQQTQSLTWQCVHDK